MSSSCPILPPFIPASTQLTQLGDLSMCYGVQRKRACRSVCLCLPPSRTVTKGTCLFRCERNKRPLFEIRTTVTYAPLRASRTQCWPRAPAPLRGDGRLFRTDKTTQVQPGLCSTLNVGSKGERRRYQQDGRLFRSHRNHSRGVMPSCRNRIHVASHADMRAISEL